MAGTIWNRLAQNFVNFCEEFCEAYKKFVIGRLERLKLLA